MLEFLAVRIHVTEADAVAPILLGCCVSFRKTLNGIKLAYSSSERELQIISTEGIVMYGRLNDLLQQLRFAEEVLRDP